MQLPFFYIAGHDISQKQITLGEDASRHIVQVLRMKAGEKLNLTDGNGNILTTSIIEVHKKHCSVQVDMVSGHPRATRKVIIAISLIKNSSRFEWFLEKATEIGVAEIIPVICERTEKPKFRMDRMQSICISAMLQSQQCWLPVLHEPIAYDLIFRQEEIAGAGLKLIAHCIPGEKRKISEFPDSKISNSIVLVGPEGDFTPAEVAIAISNHFLPVTLGETRLRTETAGMVAGTFLCMA